MSSGTRITLLVIIVLGFFAILTYEISLISAKKREAADALAKAKFISGDDISTVALRSMRNDSELEVSALQDAAVTRSELITLIETLEKAGEGRGLEAKVSSITSEARSGSTTPELVRVSIESTGSWASNMAFVRLLGSLPHKSVVESSNLSLVGRSWLARNSFVITVFPDKI